MKEIIRKRRSMMHCIDMGIALCHIAEESEAFSFAKEAGVSERKGYVYMGTVGSDYNAKEITKSAR